MTIRDLTAAFRRLPETLGRPATRATYVPQLDGLRFIAIAVVIVWHSSLRAVRYRDEHVGHLMSWYDWFPHGELGVALFFFLSGFVIAEPAFMAGTRDMDVRDFWIRRFRRIYPPYLIVLTACLGLVMASGFSRPDLSQSLLGSYAASLVYANGMAFGLPSPFDPPLWSLEVEAQFYILAPFILIAYAAVPKGPGRHWTGVAAVIASVLLMGLLSPGEAVDERFRLGLITHMHLFLGGIVASGLLAHRLPVAEPQRRAWGDVLFAAGMAGMYVLGIGLTAVDAKPMGGWPLAAETSAMLGLTIAVFLGALYGRVTAHVLSNGWLRLFGTMCFSIYLVHVPVIQILDTVILKRLPLHGNPAVYAVYLPVGMIASLAVGMVCYVFVERPFMTRRSGPKRPTVQPSSVSPEASTAT